MQTWRRGSRNQKILWTSYKYGLALCINDYAPSSPHMTVVFKRHFKGLKIVWLKCESFFPDELLLEGWQKVSFVLPAAATTATARWYWGGDCWKRGFCLSLYVEEDHISKLAKYSLDSTSSQKETQFGEKYASYIWPPIACLLITRVLM